MASRRFTRATLRRLGSNQQDQEHDIMSELSDFELVEIYLANRAALRANDDRHNIRGLRAVYNAGRAHAHHETGQEVYDRVEREYWAHRPDAVPTNIAVGEIVQLAALSAGAIVIHPGGLFPVTGVRDEGRTIDVKVDRSFTRTLLTHQVQRVHR